MRNTRITKAVRHPVLSAAVLAVMLAGSAAVTLGEENEDQAGPLVLKKQGSFFVGGQIVQTDAAAGLPGGLLGFPQAGRIAVNQMYVRYQIPQRSDHHVPVVLIHGGTLAGTCYETTPDGRMGWDEYFARKGRAVYIPDQVSRARSGFDPTRINEVKLGTQSPSALPTMFVLTQETSWQIFRFGPTFGVPWPDEQFPVEAVGELAKQEIPDQNQALPTPNPTLTNLAALAVKARGVVLLGHSESSCFPLQAALIDPTGVRGIVSIEGCSTNRLPLTPQQLAILAKTPLLMMFGDHLDTPLPPGFTGVPRATEFLLAQTQVQEINNVGGDATMIYLPDAGLHGNSHMVMQDKNNLQVADLILEWIEDHVEGNPQHGQDHHD